MRNVKVKETMTRGTGMLFTIVHLIISVLFFIIFASNNGGMNSLFDGKDNIYTIIATLLALPAMYVHELLHAFGWITSGKKMSDFNISVELPSRLFITFKGTIMGWQLAIGLILPYVVLTIVPMLIAVIFNNFYFLMFGFIMGCGCGADIYSFIKSLKHLNEDCVDTEGEIGFWVLE